MRICLQRLSMLDFDVKKKDARRIVYVGGNPCTAGTSW